MTSSSSEPVSPASPPPGRSVSSTFSCSSRRSASAAASAPSAVATTGSTSAPTSSAGRSRRPVDSSATVGVDVDTRARRAHRGLDGRPAGRARPRRELPVPPPSLAGRPRRARSLGSQAAPCRRPLRPRGEGARGGARVRAPRPHARVPRRRDVLRVHRPAAARRRGALPPDGDAFVRRARRARRRARGRLLPPRLAQGRRTLAEHRRRLVGADRCARRAARRPRAVRRPRARGGRARRRVSQFATSATGETSELDARFVVLATPAYATAVVAASLLPDRPRREALRSIPYGPYVVVALATSEPGTTRWDDLYAVATPGRAFNMIFNLANVLRGRGTRLPGGSLMLYSGGRRLAGPLLELPDDEIVERYLARPRRGVPRSARAGSTRRSSSAGRARCRTRTRGATGSSPLLDRPLERIALAGDYLGNLYTETAIQTGARRGRARSHGAHLTFVDMPGVRPDMSGVRHQCLTPATVDEPACASLDSFCGPMSSTM